MAKDKYGIEAGGNPGPGYVAKKWAGITWTLTWDEMMAVLYLAGWPRDLWATAGAVCTAESGRNPWIYNTYRRGHFGLFQISRSAHAEFFTPGGNGMGWTSPVANAKKGYEIYKSEGWGAWQAKSDGPYLAFVPAAKLAAASFWNRMQVHPNDERAWAESLIRKATSDKTMAAYLAGVDEKDLNKGALGKQLLSGIIAGAEATAEGTVASGDAVATTVADQFGWLTDLWSALTTPALWMRVGYGALGVVLVAGGLLLIVRDQPGVQKAAGAVVGAVPGGAAIKAAAAKGA